MHVTILSNKITKTFAMHSRKNKIYQLTCQPATKPEVRKNHNEALGSQFHNDVDCAREFVWRHFSIDMYCEQHHKNHTIGWQFVNDKV